MLQSLRGNNGLSVTHTKRGTNAHSAKSPPGLRIAVDPSFDRCIKAAICSKSAKHAMNPWKTTQGLRDEGTFFMHEWGAEASSGHSG